MQKYFFMNLHSLCHLNPSYHNSLLAIRSDVIKKKLLIENKNNPNGKRNLKSDSSRLDKDINDLSMFKSHKSIKNLQINMEKQNRRELH